VRRVSRARRELAPWSGLILGGLGWAISHQAGSDSVTSNCIGTHPWLLLVIGLAGLAMSAIGGLISLAVMRRGGDETMARRFIAVVSVMAALLLGLAIVVQTSAGLIIPRCFA